ncbi:MAG: hypothetical protein WAT23_01955 [Chromatiaceae bacterium]
MGAPSGDLKLVGLLTLATLGIIALLGYFGAPLLAEASAALAQGIGLKTATLWGFGTTVALFLLFALVAGDGILGELPFMLGAFFTFFAILTLLIAWIF